MTTISTRQRVLGGLIGSLVGDALGVPEEFKSRSEVQRNPATGMRGHSTHNQPAGSWSDDSSLTLASCDSLANSHDLETEDMGRRFVNWETKGHYTANGTVFDIGGATSAALPAFSKERRRSLFLPTKKLIQMSVHDPKYILRQPLVFTNLSSLFPGTGRITVLPKPSGVVGSPGH